MKTTLSDSVKQIVVLFFFASMAGAGCTMIASNDVGETAGTTTLFIVRHAEKADDGTEDPSLTPAGQERAEALARVLSDAGVTSIYSTPYKRNRETAAPLAKLLGIDVGEYQPHDESFLRKVAGKERDRKVLVVGHSNTVPAMVNRLIGKEQFNDLQESEYDHLFMVQLATDTTLTVLHYGASTKGAN